MNKKAIRIAGWALCLSMAVVGIGASVGAAFNPRANEISQVNATDFSVTFTVNSGDGTSIGTTTSMSNIVDTTTYVTGNATAATKAYYGGLYGLKLGASSNAGTLSFSLDKSYAITSVVVNAKLYNSSKAATLNVNSKGAQSLSADFDNYTFTFDGTNVSSLTFASSKYIWVSGFTVNYQNTVALTGITSVSLSSNSVPANYDGAVTATAVYTPNGTANEEIVWSSSNSSVATIAAGDTYGQANITIKGVGSCTFTAKNQNGSITCTSGTFTVTEAVVLPYYTLSFKYYDSDSTTKYSNASNAQNDLMGDTSLVTVSSVDNVFHGADNTFKFGTGSATGSIGFTTSSAVKTVIVEAANYGSDTTSLDVTLGESTNEGTALTSDFAYYVYHFNTASTSFSISGSSSGGKRYYLKSLIFVIDGNADVEGAFGFSAELLQGTAAGCSALDSVALATKWSDLSSAYTTMKSSYSGSDTYFAGAEANVSGNLVVRAAARYDYIVGKYLKTLGNASFTDFADRNPAAVLGANNVSNIASSINGSSTLAIIAGIASVGVITLVGGSFFLSRRKKD